MTLFALDDDRLTPVIWGREASSQVRAQVRAALATQTTAPVFEFLDADALVSAIAEMSDTGLTILTEGVSDDVRASVRRLSEAGVHIRIVSVRSYGGTVLVSVESVEDAALASIRQATPIQMVEETSGSTGDESVWAASRTTGDSRATGETAGTTGTTTGRTSHAAPDSPWAARSAAEEAWARRREASSESRSSRGSTDWRSNEFETTPMPRITVPTWEGDDVTVEELPGLRRGHRSTGPVLGAQPTVTSGNEAAQALALVAASLQTPARLVWDRPRRGIHHEAILDRSGRMTLSTGESFVDPSAAANAAQHTQDIDGWRVWRLGVTGPSLAELLTR